jgi:hypothetical protein
MAIQRFPEEYDGLLVGAPAINWDRFIPSELWPQIVMNQELGAPIAATDPAASICKAGDDLTKVPHPAGGECRS